MISIDTVYQKVLALANKEQRGYITPQEFNLFADQAQKEIFEQYFYDLNQFKRTTGNASEYGDVVDILNEKISVFESTGTGTGLANNLYRLGTVVVDSKEVEEVQQKELLYINQSTLAAPTVNRRIYVRNSNNTITVYPSATNITYNYIASPSKPNWTYVVINGKAMYDSSNKNDFDLHPADENELVYKILKFAGISMGKNDLAQAGQGLEVSQIQQEKQ